MDVIDELVEGIKTTENMEGYPGKRLADKHSKAFDQALTKGILTVAKCQKLIFTCIDHWNDSLIEQYVCKLMADGTPIKWPANQDLLTSILDRIVAKAQAKNRPSMNCRKFFEELYKMLLSCKLFVNFKKKLYDIIVASSKKSGEPDHPIHSVCYGLLSRYPWEKEKISAIPKIFSRVSEMAKKQPTICKGDLYQMVTQTVSKLVMFYQNHSENANDITGDVAALLHFFVDEDWRNEDNPNTTTLAYDVLLNLVGHHLLRHRFDMNIMEPNMDVVKRLWECGDDKLEEKTNDIFHGIADNYTLLGDHASLIVDRYISGEDRCFDYISSFPMLFKGRPEIFYERMDDFFEIIEEGGLWAPFGTLRMFYEIAQQNTEVFTEKHISIVADYLSVEDSTTRNMATLILRSVAKTTPKKVVKHDKALKSALMTLDDLSGTVGEVLVALATLSKQKAGEYMELVWKGAQESDRSHKPALLWTLRNLGRIRLDLLKTYKPKLMEMQKDMMLKDHVKILIDMIEGRSLQNMAEDISEHREDIDNVDLRVTTNEQNVSTIAENVKDVQNDVTDVKWDVTEQEARLDDIEEVVDDTADKVIDIDRKVFRFF